MRGFMKYACVLALPLLVAAGAAQAQTWPDGGNPSEGATLYDIRGDRAVVLLGV